MKNEHKILELCMLSVKIFLYRDNGIVEIKQWKINNFTDAFDICLNETFYKHDICYAEQQTQNGQIGTFFFLTFIHFFFHCSYV